ncbi:MAG: hypothetical protein R3F08_09710 [Dokdonella sp.]
MVLTLQLVPPFALDPIGSANANVNKCERQRQRKISRVREIASSWLRTMRSNRSPYAVGVGAKVRNWGVQNCDAEPLAADYDAVAKQLVGFWIIGPDMPRKRALNRVDHRNVLVAIPVVCIQMLDAGRELVPAVGCSRFRSVS